MMMTHTVHANSYPTSLYHGILASSSTTTFLIPGQGRDRTAFLLETASVLGQNVSNKVSSCIKTLRVGRRRDDHQP